MGEVSVGDRVVKDRRGVLSRCWLEIEETVDSQFQLPLRDAVNIVGFFHFPIGWTWSEYELPKLRGKDRVYDVCDSKIQKRIRFGLKPLPQSEEGERASQAAAAYRRRLVERKLYQIVARQDARLILTDASCQGRIAKEPDVLDETLKFDIEGSGVIIRGEWESAAIDGIDLLKYLNALEKRWGMREGVHDWWLAERLIRDFIGSRGCEFSNQEIMDHCQDEYSRLDPEVETPLDKSRYAALAAALRKEYEFSVEKMVVSTEE